MAPDGMQEDPHAPSEEQMSTRPFPLVVAAAVVVAVAAGSVLTAPALASDRVIVVQPGQTLSQIAVEHGVSLQALVALNGLADPDRIYAGQRLRVAPEPAATSATPTAAPAAAPRTHTVRHGENLTWIAARYGTGIDAIVVANGIVDASYIRAGQQLTIPAAVQPVSASPAAAPAAPAASHLVASGETLSGIAVRYGVSVQALVAANGILDASYIRSGKRLIIPGAPAPGAAAASPAGLPEPMRTLVASRDAVRQLIVAEAQRQGVPAAFALAVAWQESGWQQGVVSSAGAIGVMQLIPATGDWVSASMLGEPVNLWDAHANVRAGIRLLRHYLDRYGDRSLALAAYYQGQTATDRHGIFAISRPYVASILALEALFAR
jgi:LysM repeat protein